MTDSQGVPWTAAYVNANGELSVDLRSNIAAESRAKIVYEYLLQFTDDPYVKDSLNFLMTREIAHFQMFSAALDTIQPNFPPGVLQGDPRFTHTYYNMSNGADVPGAWNQGQGPWSQGEHWEYVDDPVQYSIQTQGLINQPIRGTSRSPEDVQRLDQEMSRRRSEEVMKAVPKRENQWSAYPQTTVASPTAIDIEEEEEVETQTRLG